jgi:hypothetical protein
MINFMMRIVAGSPGTEDEAAESEIEKKFLAEFKEIFYPSLSMNVCDFFPILRLIGYKGIEKKFVKLQKLRDEYLEKIIDGIRSKKNTCSMDGGEKKIMSLVENLLSLQQSEPEFYTDDVIKSMILVSIDLFICFSLFWQPKDSNLGQVFAIHLIILYSVCL